ncbi:J domain-containing protein [Pannonibacter phragmitetus]|uniref:J domain-containing protein n=1 Tax=Pannonibacter phragmitetus TaxID=121719 RepID=UPI000E664E1C|nr:J domain-containing protein [Pannonibacter phragmitetus]
MYSEGKAGWPFGALGLDEPSSDAKVIKRAYARQLKQLDQASEAEAFQALRQAYETALRQAETRTGIGTGTGTVEGHGDRRGHEHDGALLQSVTGSDPSGPVADLSEPVTARDRAAEAEDGGEPASGRQDRAADEAFAALRQAIYDLKPSRRSASRLLKLLARVEDFPHDEQRDLGFAVMFYLRRCLEQRDDGGYVLKTGFSEKLKFRLNTLFHWWDDAVEMRKFVPDEDELSIALIKYCGSRILNNLKNFSLLLFWVFIYSVSIIFIALLVLAFFAGILWGVYLFVLALPVGALSKAYIMASFSVLLLLLQSSVVREGLRDSFCKFFVRMRR